MKSSNILILGVVAFFVGGVILVEKQEQNGKIMENIKDIEVTMKNEKEEFFRKMKFHKESINEKELRNKYLEHMTRMSFIERKAQILKEK